MALKEMLCVLDKNWKSGKMRAETHRKEAIDLCLCGSASCDEIPFRSPAIVYCLLPCGF